MARIKSEEDIAHLREGGRRLGEVVKAVGQMVKPGISIAELNEAAEALIRKNGDVPAFLDYMPEGAERPFPATICISVNEEVVHGIPNEDPRILEEGDIVSLDCGLVHNGLIVDHAISVIAGTPQEGDVELLQKTREALYAGIAKAHAGARIGDISEAIEEVGAESGYGIVYELGGHGVGHRVHEPPYIPNVGKKGTGEEILAGMVLAIEPMLTHGSDDVVLMADGYTYVTSDKSRAAHFEHTVVITENGPEIVTEV